MSISYIANGESGNATVLNRPLKAVLTALGIADVDNPVPAFTKGGNSFVLDAANGIRFNLTDGGGKDIYFSNFPSESVEFFQGEGEISLFGGDTKQIKIQQGDAGEEKRIDLTDSAISIRMKSSGSPVFLSAGESDESKLQVSSTGISIDVGVNVHMFADPDMDTGFSFWTGPGAIFNGITELDIESTFIGMFGSDTTTVSMAQGTSNTNQRTVSLKDDALQIKSRGTVPININSTDGTTDTIKQQILMDNNSIALATPNRQAIFTDTGFTVKSIGGDAGNVVYFANFPSEDIEFGLDDTEVFMYAGTAGVPPETNLQVLPSSMILNHFEPTVGNVAEILLDVGGVKLQTQAVGKIGFFGTTPVVKQTITGARNLPEGALKNLLTKLDTIGLFIDSTTAI